ncbi:hypothetical protein KEJ44_04190 [Candidatus Bathyarchaeota archaeon]|nr:hypothetical protein [Candidatus Bathyarchaeota archaeon]
MYRIRGLKSVAIPLRAKGWITPDLWLIRDNNPSSAVIWEMRRLSARM